MIQQDLAFMAEFDRRISGLRASMADVDHQLIGFGENSWLGGFQPYNLVTVVLLDLTRCWNAEVEDSNILLEAIATEEWSEEVVEQDLVVVFFLSLTFWRTVVGMVVVVHLVTVVVCFQNKQSMYNI